MQLYLSDIKSGTFTDSILMFIETNEAEVRNMVIDQYYADPKYLVRCIGWRNLNLFLSDDKVHKTRDRRRIKTARRES